MNRPVQNNDMVIVKETQQEAFKSHRRFHS